MLHSLKLSNFRCFEEHTVELQPKTLIVGKNNAGKSSCVEALRLVSLVTERLDSLHLRVPPNWTGLPRRAYGVAPSLEGIDIHGTSLFFNYNEPPAVISARFQNGSRIDVHIGPELALHAVVYDMDGAPCRGRAQVSAARIPRVSILPQIAPLNENELVLEDRYVRQNVQTSRGSLHFRNQLRIYGDLFPELQREVAASWHGIALNPLLIPPNDRRATEALSLLVRDNDFTAEAAWMGHGLQMWLQIIWFLVRSARSSVLILDEPDVYMHADLQRRLVRMLMRDPRQFVIATHSPEMLAEVEPEAVVILDRRRKTSKPATSSKAVQEVLLRVGSVHNLSLARLAIQRRLLLVEGKDVSLLKRLQNIVDPDSDRPIDTVPSVSIGGWSGWPSALTLSRFLQQNAAGEITVFCLLDRDYHAEETISKRLAEARAAGVELTIWTAKEIENYLVVPSAIARLLSNRTRGDVSVQTVEAAVDSAVAALRDDAFASTVEAYRSLDPAAGVKTAMKAATPIFNERWNHSGGRFAVNGKDLRSAIFQWAQDQFGVSLSAISLIQALRPAEVHEEVRRAIRAITTR